MGSHLTAFPQKLFEYLFYMDFHSLFKPASKERPSTVEQGSTLTACALGEWARNLVMRLILKIIKYLEIIKIYLNFECFLLFKKEGHPNYGSFRSRS